MYAISFDMEVAKLKKIMENRIILHMTKLEKLWEI